VKLSLCITKHYAMKAYGGVDVEIHIFLTSAVVLGEWSASSLGRFTTLLLLYKLAIASRNNRMDCLSDKASDSYSAGIEFKSQSQNRLSGRHATCFMLVSCLAWSSILKMGATWSSEMSVGFQLTARRYIIATDVRTAGPS
jgi:hypothetical protein